MFSDMADETMDHNCIDLENVEPSIVYSCGHISISYMNDSIMTQLCSFLKGSTCCSDCKGTGFRAKWLGKPLPTE